MPDQQRLGDRLLERAIRHLLRNRIHVPPKGDSASEQELVAHTEEFNRAAEDYYARYPWPNYLLGKPFSDPGEFPRYLFNLGVLFHGLRLAPGDLVVELGAGTCWVSHFLNLYGCRTISIDVSPTALELGREVFTRSAQTRWDLEPEFRVYDGHRLPLADGSCDRIVVHDAFHHIPNQEEILREMVRVLRHGSIVAMVEPGRAHSQTAESREEMTTGVLENDIVLEDLEATAKRCGFTQVTVLPLSLTHTSEVEAASFLPLLGGRGLPEFWTRLSQGLVEAHYILLYNGEFRPNSRRAEHLAASIDVEGVDDGFLRIPSMETAALSCRVQNVGGARWIGLGPRRGLTKLGGHLFEAGATGCLDWDWLRVELGRDVEPGEACELQVLLPALEPGRYRLELDLVAEDVAWFAELGSATCSIEIEALAPERRGESPVP